MKIKKIICYVLMFVSVFVLFACDYNPTQTKIEISGTVYFNNAPLDGVSIRSNTKNFCTTENDGNFIFEENSNSITIFAEKSGYIFSPKSITLSKSQSGIIFEATKIENLNGTLSLSKINITPISIASIQENYLFKNSSGESCLKINQINVSINDNELTALNSCVYAVKYKNNEIDFNKDLSVNTGTKFKILFSVDACYSFASSEQVYTEAKKSVINVTENQTNADLVQTGQNEFGQIVYTLAGVNAGNNNYSYDISFVFDYYPN